MSRLEKMEVFNKDNDNKYKQEEFNPQEIIKDLRDNFTTDTGVTIEQVVKFIIMNGTAYREELWQAMAHVQTDEDLKIDYDLLEEKDDIWKALADM